MNIGICGYGNLGKAVEKIAKCDCDINLVAIFSRRNVTSPLGTKVEKYENANKYIGKIDCMIMCGGSYNDVVWQSPEMLKYFNIIDSFDTHAKIAQHKQNLLEVSSTSGKTAIYSCGWDPGLFSVMRVYETIFLNNSKVYTFWGKGVSQGHSDALRRIEGVKDAIQFTVPKTSALKKIKEGKDFDLDGADMHRRVCYVAKQEGANEGDILTKILNMPNYFAGQEVCVNFVEQKEILKLKKRMFHAGKVVGSDKNAYMQFSVKMESNPQFTAKIMLAYAKIIQTLNVGVYSPLDIAPSMLFDGASQLI